VYFGTYFGVVCGLGGGSLGGFPDFVIFPDIMPEILPMETSLLKLVVGKTFNAKAEMTSKRWQEIDMLIATV
jgi:hypothetical protein